MLSTKRIAQQAVFADKRLPRLTAGLSHWLRENLDRRWRIAA